MEAEELDRTTPLGWFNYAHSYAASGQALEMKKVRATHDDAPVRALYRHAIELYLKAYLLSNGRSAAQLRREFGHNTEKLIDEARSLGLQIDEEQRDQIAFLKDALQDRYLETGFRQILDDGVMLTLCRKLNELIGPEIYRRTGIVRIPHL